MIRFRSFSTVRFAFGLGLFLALGASGCGNSEGGNTLSGTVKLDGTPVPGGMIKALPAGGSDTALRSALIGDNGHYYMPNVPTGAVKFAVEGPGKSSAPNAPPPAVVVPAKYSNPDQSGLTWTVKEGSNTHDIDLTK